MCTPSFGLSLVGHLYFLNFFVIIEMLHRILVDNFYLNLKVSSWDGITKVEQGWEYFLSLFKFFSSSSFFFYWSLVGTCCHIHSRWFDSTTLLPAHHRWLSRLWILILILIFLRSLIYITDVSQGVFTNKVPVGRFLPADQGYAPRMGPGWGSQCPTVSRILSFPFFKALTQGFPVLSKCLFKKFLKLIN